MRYIIQRSKGGHHAARSRASPATATGRCKAYEGEGREMMKFLQVFLLTAFAMAVVISALAASIAYGGPVVFISVYVVLMSAAVSTMYCLWGKP